MSQDFIDPVFWQPLKNDAEAPAYKGCPLDNLATLATAKVPILLVYGDADKVVPPQKNSEALWDRNQALGSAGKSETIRPTAIPLSSTLSTLSARRTCRSP